MAGRRSVRVIDSGADDILLQWLRECDSDVDEDVAATSDGSDEEDCIEVQSEYDSENSSDPEPASSDSDNQRLNFYM